MNLILKKKKTNEKQQKDNI